MATSLGAILLIGLAVSTTHDTVFDLLSMLQLGHIEEAETASNCQSDSDCEGCICTCHIFAESLQLDSSNPTQPPITYLTPHNASNCYSVILEALERPPEHSQI